MEESEVNLFNAMVRWARAECKRNVSAIVLLPPIVFECSVLLHALLLAPLHVTRVWDAA